MRLGHEYSIDIRSAKFKFTPYHKFNILLDKSGVGKTHLLKEIAYNAFDTDMRVFNSYGDINLVKQPNNFLILFDESHIYKFIDKYGIDTLNNSDNVYLVVCRDLIDFTSIDYRAVYILQSNKHNYEIKRKFLDYRSFLPSTHILVEDSQFGLSYYKKYYPEAVTSNGKKNINKLICDNTTVVADGSAIAYDFNKFIKTRKTNVKFFLPDSFEGLVLENTKSAVECVKAAHEDPVLKYVSIEAYYTDKISNYYTGYTKAKGHPSILTKDLLHVKRNKDTSYIASLCPKSVANRLGLKTDDAKARYVIDNNLLD